METERRAGVVFAIAMVLAIAAVAAEPAGTVDEALRARQRGDYAAAVKLLREARAEAPRDNHIELLLAETLGWEKKFDEAISVYRDLLTRSPQLHAARRGLAQVLLWKGDYRGARHEFSRLIRSNGRDAEALEGRGTAEYWSGDFRSAARDFRSALAIDARRDFSRRSLAQIEASTRPEERVSIGAVDDDQPYRLWRASASEMVVSDPLTRWTATAGTYRASAPIYGTAAMPFVEIGNETVVPSLRLTIASSGGIVRYGDGVTRPTGGLTLTRPISENDSILLSARRQELLATATGLSSHPSVATYSAGWRRTSKNGWLGAAEVSMLRYFDSNRGTGAWAYGLAPLLNHGTTRLYGGASGTYRDSRDSRFSFAAVSSIRITPNDFAYAYRGVYAPYWAPQRFREARAIVLAQTTVRSIELKLHADAGVARDRAVAFGPSNGPLPLPPSIHSFHFDRSFHPYRGELTATAPLGRALTAEIGVEWSSTIFYRAKTFHASLVRRR